jgi:hypothetical protein
VTAGDYFVIRDSTANAQRLVIDTNGNVGINSTGPQAKLDVEGSVYVGNGNVGIGTTSTAAVLHVADSGLAPNLIAFQNGSTNRGYLGFDGTNSIKLSSSGAARMVFMMSTNYVMSISTGLNVGIGTTGASAKLTVLGTEGSAVPTFETKDQSGNITTSVLGNGNMGIGSSVPSEKLDVLGTVKAAAFIGDGSGLTGISAGSGGWSDGGANVYLATSTDNVGIGTSVPRASLEVAGGAYFMGANVGIGSSAPQKALDVQGDVAFKGSTGNTIIMDGSNIYNNGGLYFTDTQGATFRGPLLNDTTVGWYIRNQYNGGTLALQTETSGGSTNSDQLVLVGNTGNVGIGSSSPVQKLEVIGTVKATAFVGDGSGLTGVVASSSVWGRSGTNIYPTVLTDNVGIGSSTPAARLVLANPTGSTYLRIESCNDCGGDAFSAVDLGQTAAFSGVSFNRLLQKLNFNTNSNGYQFTLDNTSNVGLSSGTPGARLDIVGSGTTSATRALTIRDSTAAAKVTVLDNGNVGIGTSVPQVKLQVAGDLNVGVDGAAERHFNVYSDVAGAYFAIDNYGNYGGHYSYGMNNFAFDNTMAGGYITFWTSDGTQYERMRIDSNGNVGINSSAPRARLDVEGSVYLGNGNVGINSSAPSQRVDVIGTVKATAFIGDGSGLTGLAAAGGWSDGGANVYLTTGTDNVGIGSAAPQAKLELVGSGTTSATKALVIRDSALAARLTVLDNGNVGIGTSQPSNGFQVKNSVVSIDGGTLYVSSGSNTTHSFYNTGGALLAYTGATKYVSINTNQSNNMLTVNGSVAVGAIDAGPANGIYVYGNAGIGSSAPQAKLDVEGSVYIGNGNVGIGVQNSPANLGVLGTILLAGTTPTMWMYENDASANNVIWDTSINSEQLTMRAINDAYSVAGNWLEVDRTGTTIDKVVFPNGNVGIGSSVPQTKLDVVGTVTATVFSGSAAQFTSAGNVGIGSSAPQQKLVVVGNIYFNGNVGIGSSVPAKALDVVGTVRQTNCKTAGTLSANTSGDIVCTSDERLKTVYGEYQGGLEELGAIIPIRFSYNGESFIHVGFSAQNVKAVLPEASALQDSGYWSLDNTAVIALAVNAIKEQKAQIEGLKGENERLRMEFRGETAVLRKELEELRGLFCHGRAEGEPACRK